MNLQEAQLLQHWNYLGYRDPDDKMIFGAVASCTNPASPG